MTADTLIAPLDRPEGDRSDTTRVPDVLSTLAAAVDATQGRAREFLALTITTDLQRLVAPLDPEDQTEFYRELCAALNEPFERLEEVLEEWLITLRAVEDPVNREILLGEIDPADFIEVARPE
jgi:hypothetical protein